MGEVIQIQDLYSARERADRRHRDHRNIEQALALMRKNLAWTAEQLCSAPKEAQAELLERIEKLTATIRYGMQMLGDTAEGTAADSLNRHR